MSLCKLRVPIRPLDPGDSFLPSKLERVYFISCECGVTRFVKIGISRNIRERLAALQCSCPFQLTLLAQTGQIKNARAVEIALHGYFSDFRQTGEWFRWNVFLEELVRHVQRERSIPDRYIGP